MRTHARMRFHARENVRMRGAEVRGSRRRAWWFAAARVAVRGGARAGWFVAARVVVRGGARGGSRREAAVRCEREAYGVNDRGE